MYYTYLSIFFCRQGQVILASDDTRSRSERIHWQTARLAPARVSLPLLLNRFKCATSISMISRGPSLAWYDNFILLPALHIHTHSRPVQSWTGENLYNLWRRSLGELSKETDFTRTQKTLFQQRWIAKRLIRAYHGDFINEKAFKRWYLPTTLPDVRPRRGQAEDHAAQLNKWAKLPKAVEKDAKTRRQEVDGEAQEELPPVGSLMFSEVERRIDVVIFRACLAHSVYDARRMVVHGKVLLNGKKVRLRRHSLYD